MGLGTLAGLAVMEAGATEFDQVKKWDYEAGIVVLGIEVAGLKAAITAYDPSSAWFLVALRASVPLRKSPGHSCR